MKKYARFIVGMLFPVKNQEKVREKIVLSAEELAEAEERHKMYEVRRKVYGKYRQPKLPTIQPDYEV